MNTVTLVLRRSWSDRARCTVLVSILCMAVVPIGGFAADGEVATPPNPVARAAAAESRAFLRAGMYAEALAAANRAVLESPAWPEAYLIRAEATLARSAPEPVRLALPRGPPGTNYDVLLEAIGSAQRDVARALSLDPSGPDAPSLQIRAEELSRQGAEAAVGREQAKAALRAAAEFEQQRRAEAERADQAEQAKARAEKAEQRRANQAAERARVETGRSRGKLLLGVGAILGAGAGAAAYLGKSQNDKVARGGLPDAAAIQSAANTGRTYNFVAYGMAVGASAFSIWGVAKILGNPLPDPGPEIGLAPTTGGLAVVVAGRLP